VSPQVGQDALQRCGGVHEVIEEPAAPSEDGWPLRPLQPHPQRVRAEAFDRLERGLAGYGVVVKETLPRA
jgi:hypothetical protein